MGGDKGAVVVLFVISKAITSSLSSPHPLNPSDAGLLLWRVPWLPVGSSPTWAGRESAVDRWAPACWWSCRERDRPSVGAQSRAPLTHCLAVASVETWVSLCFSVMAQLHPTFGHPSHTPQTDLTTWGDLHFSTDTLTLEQTIFIERWATHKSMNPESPMVNLNLFFPDPSSPATLETHCPKAVLLQARPTVLSAVFLGASH